MNWRTLQHWEYIFGKEGESGVGTPSHGGSRSDFSFVELRSAPVATDGRFMLEVGEGRRVHVPASFDAEALRRLLGVLEGRA
jgi:hypothetical protein